jgi:hypothetical protein
MTLKKVAQVAAILSVSVPLAASAWSAVAYVRLRGREVQRERYQRFFEVMDNLGKPAGSVASKMGAVYEPRKFPEYADVIVRLFDQVDVDGQSAPMLKAEMSLTADFLRRKARS